jgi:hypothetical protein
MLRLTRTGNNGTLGSHAGIDVPLRDLIQAFGDQADPFWREEWDHGTERWAEDGPPDYLGKKWRTASGEL